MASPRVSSLPCDSTLSITLPYRFDTSSVWRSILKGAFGLNALLVFSVFYAALVQQQIAKALGVTIIEGVAFVFTRIFVRFQTGSVGTLSSDEVVIEPNALFGVTLPGPHGTYALDRFRAVRVEFRPGPHCARCPRSAERAGVARRPPGDAGHRARVHRRPGRACGGARVRRAAAASRGRGGRTQGDQALGADPIRLSA
jgi:hypothetical protein